MSGIDRTELMSKLADHAQSLGWEIVEWNWKDEIDGADEYQLWVQPLTGNEGGAR